MNNNYTGGVFSYGSIRYDQNWQHLSNGGGNVKGKSIHSLGELRTTHGGDLVNATGRVRAGWPAWQSRELTDFDAEVLEPRDFPW